jgi:hypothetical protein
MHIDIRKEGEKEREEEGVCTTGIKESDLKGAKEEGEVRPKTKSMTFRISASVLDELQAEAEQQEVSLNVLVNQILRRYNEWDRYESKLGMMPVPKLMLTLLIDKAIETAKKSGLKEMEPYRDQIMKEAVNIAYDIMRDEVLFMKRSYNLWTALAVLQEYMKVSGINSDHKVEPGGRHVFIIQHDLGENWSLFTKGLLNKIFEELASVRAEISITSNTTIARVILR